MHRRFTHFRFTSFVLAIGVLSLSAQACAKWTRAEIPEQPSPVVLVAVDGLEWDVLLPLLEAERLPNISRLMDRGQYGKLKTMQPTWSPVIWTTVATGKSPDAHGIDHFVRQELDGSRSLYQSQDRLTKAIWNIASDYERRVNVIGWWMTWPVEPITGLMVAQTNTTDQLDTEGGLNIWKGALRAEVPEQVFPTDREAEMLGVLRGVEAGLPELTRGVFGEFPYPLTPLGRRLWDNCQWAFRADATYLEIALRVAAEQPLADLTMLYLGGPDVVGHRFWRYRTPGIYADPPSAREIENLGQIIDDYYVYLDQAIGQLVQAHGPDTTFVVASDHGMQPVNREGRFDPHSPPADINSADHPFAPPGVLIAAGPGIASRPAVPHLQRENLERVGEVIDIAPTILAMLRLPQGRDLEGRVLEDLFAPRARIKDQPRAVATHDTPAFLAAREGDRPEDPGEEERLEQLRSLGYIN